VTSEFKNKLAIIKTRYDSWLKDNSFDTARLVHYCGVDSPNSIDIESNCVWENIQNCLEEGFFVDWGILDKKIFVLVQEPGCPIPSWEKVYAEQEIENVDEILRKAGFTANT
jgi:hypothetical protein